MTSLPRIWTRRRAGWHADLLAARTVRWVSAALLVLLPQARGAEPALPPGAAAPAPVASPAAIPALREVLQAIQTNLAGSTEAELDQAAVRGLIRELHPRVQWVDPGLPAGAANAATPGAAVTQSGLFRATIGYVRVGTVGPSLAGDLRSAAESLAASNRLEGMVLDLRFAGGQDYAAAAAAADLFVAEPQPLLDWGEGPRLATAKTNAMSMPLAILVNRQTADAAEALAEALRQVKAGLILGAPTAGTASRYTELTLSNGSKLRVASTPVRAGTGPALAPRGIEPDLAVPVALDAERRYWADAYATVESPRLAVSASRGTNTAAGRTNLATRRSINEAELVRRHRNGFSDDDEPGPAADRSDRAPRTVQDPVLSRALDLLRGLALARRPGDADFRR